MDYLGGLSIVFIVDLRYYIVKKLLTPGKIQKIQIKLELILNHLNSYLYDFHASATLPKKMKKF